MTKEQFINTYPSKLDHEDKIAMGNCHGIMCHECPFAVNGESRHNGKNCLNWIYDYIMKKEKLKEIMK